MSNRPPIDNLEILIQANADQFRAELNDVNKRLLGMQEGANAGQLSIGKLSKAMFIGQTAAKAFTVASRAIVNTTKKVVSEVVKGGGAFSRLKISTDTVTQNMGITAEAVDDLRDSLADANTYGIEAENVIRSLALSGLFELSSELEAVDARTGEYVKGVTALTLVMKDLAASAGIESAEGINALTEFINTGNLSITRGIMQLTNMNVEYRRYADTVGKTVQQLSAEERARVRMNIVMREGEKAFGAYANTYTTSGKMINSVGEAMKANFQILGGSLEPIFAALSSAVLTFTNNIRQFLLDNVGTFKQWATSVAAYVVVVIRVLGKMLSKLPIIGGHMKNLAEFEFPQVTVGADKASGAMNDFGRGLDNASGSARALRKELLGLAGFDEMNVLKQPDEQGGGIGIGAIEIPEIGLADSFAREFENIGEDINKNVEEIELKFELFKERLSSIWGDFSWFDTSQIRETWDWTMMDINSSAERWLPRIQVRAGEILNDIGSDFKYYGEMFKGIWDDALGTISDTWRKHTWNITEYVGEFMWNIIDLFGLLWSDLLSPIITPFLNTFQKLWDDVLGDAFGEIVEFVMGTIEVFLLLINRSILPLISILVDFFEPAFRAVGRKLSSVFELFGGVVGHVIDGIFGALNGLLKFLKGSLTLNWKLALEGLRDIFSSVLGGIVGIGKSIINYFIREINNFIREINKVKVPNWVPGVGGKGFNIKPINYLAQGGIIESPTVAMMGEGYHKEVVLPLDRNTEWAEQVADLISGSGSAPIHLVVNVGNEKMAEKVIEVANERSARTGKLVFNI